MMARKIKFQQFRKNDLVADSGKQFELGASWCADFFSFVPANESVSVTLTFKSLTETFLSWSGRQVELELAPVTNRGDRKAYANGRNGYSQIKDFFINDLKLTVEKNGSDYFAICRSGCDEYFLYVVPRWLFHNIAEVLDSEISAPAPPRPIVSCSPLPLQQIFYGAPGTGKSRAVSELTEGRDVVRTTFHPDSDYSTFVGVYKPATKDEETTDAGGVARRETKIVYEFVPQAFLKAYAKAWKKLVGAAGGAPEPQFLVVEEINRGNCAQVFGDLFQLLDRAPDGFSAYPIEADTDLCRHLRSEFEGCAAPWLGADADRALRGETLLLPPNLHIWATMNTSDQSLFPVDSAFKRRWDWHYTPIYDAALGWVVRAGARRYDWWQFLEKINDNIAALTSSEDKKLGYFFCKATDGVISAETFVGKVLFYLWNDVFKDYGTDSPLFDAPDGRRLTFSDFYAVEGGAAKADETKVEILMGNLGVEALPDEESGDGL